MSLKNKSEFDFGNGRQSCPQNGRHVPTFSQALIPQGERRSINSEGSVQASQKR